MPDIQFFDAAGFFAQKISETEQSLISKKAELEILYSNRRNLEMTVDSFGQLSPDQQQVIQAEIASLREVLAATERSIAGLEAEADLLSGKLGALQTARELLKVTG